MKKHLQYAFRPGTGRTVPQAQIRVKASPSSDGDANVVVYSDRAGTIPLTQPFLTSDLGRIEFYAADGRYDIYYDYDDIHGVDRDVDHYDLSVLDSGPASANDARFVTAVAHSALTSEIIIPSFLGHPDILPTSPGAIDDEFNSDLSAWTPINNDGGTSLSTNASQFTLSQSATASVTPVGLYRTLTPGSNFIVWASVALGYHPGMSGIELAGERPFWGLGLRSSLGEISALGLRGSAQELGICQADFDTTGLLNADNLHSVGVNAVYVRIRKASSNYLFEWSTNGRSWVTAKQVTSLFSGTVVQVGLFALPSFETGGVFNGTSDFIRYQ